MARAQLAFRAAGPPGLEDELEGVRRLGYAIDDGQTAIGIRCIAAPLFNDNACCGALGVSYLLGGVPAVEIVVEALLEAAGRASDRLGGRFAQGSAALPIWPSTACAPLPRSVGILPHAPRERASGCGCEDRRPFTSTSTWLCALGTRELSPPAPGEATVLGVAWAGVCGSDLHVLRSGAWVAYWPATLGHEVVGVVEDCPGNEVPVGVAVAVDSRLPLRALPGSALKSAGSSLCYRMSWLGEARPGGFARHLVVPATSLVPCPAGLELAIAVLAEPLAITMHAVSGLTRRPGRALIMGYGPIGALGAPGAHAAPLARALPVAVLEPTPARLQLSMALGASDPHGQLAGSSQGADRRSYAPGGGRRRRTPQSLTDACRSGGQRGDRHLSWRS